MPSPECLQAINTADVFSFLELLHAQKEASALQKKELVLEGKV